MKKIIILIVLTFLISGCSSEYNLKITSDKIEENIDIVIDKSLIGSDAGNPDDPANPTEEDDQITPFLGETQYPFSDNSSKVYDKKVTEDEDNYYVHLNYDFLPSEYGNSKAISSCFENHEYTENKDFYEIKLSGNFYCLYADSLVIRLETPNIVEENNASQIEGTTYIWKIDQSNVRNTDISIKILKKTAWQQNLIYGIVGALILVCVIVALVVFNVFMKKESRNKI